jgi:hypothetical protein
VSERKTYLSWSLDWDNNVLLGTKVSSTESKFCLSTHVSMITIERSMVTTKKSIIGDLDSPQVCDKHKRRANKDSMTD